MRNHCAVLPVYKDGEGCGLGTLWQEICKFTAHREKGFGAELGMSHWSRHNWRERGQETRQKPACNQGPGACWKRGVKGSCLGCQKEILALLLWLTHPEEQRDKSPANRAGHGSPSWSGGWGEAARRGADVWTCLENTTESFGMQMACQRERQHR